LKSVQDENISLQVVESGPWTHLCCFGEVERQEGTHVHSW